MRDEEEEALFSQDVLDNPSMYSDYERQQATLFLKERPGLIQNGLIKSPAAISAANPAPAPAAPAQSPYQTQMAELYANAKQTANPFSGNNAGLMAMMSNARNQVNQNYNTGAQTLRSQLASRGMLGGGREASAIGGYQAQHGAALSSAMNGLTAQNHQQAAAWDQNHNRYLSDLLAQQNSADLSQGQLDLMKKRYADEQSNRGMENLGNFASGVGQIGGAIVGGVFGGPPGAMAGYYAGGAAGKGLSGLLNKSPLPGGGPFEPRDQWGRAY